MNIQVTRIVVNRCAPAPDVVHQHLRDNIEIYTNAPTPDGYSFKQTEPIEFDTEYCTGVEFCQKNYPGVAIELNCTPW